MEYITKETAIKAIQGLCIEENTPQMIWSTDAMDAVRNAPDGWISVKDRLPEKETIVIVAVFGHDLIAIQEGETLKDAIKRVRKKVRYVTIGGLYEDGWYGPAGFPMVTPPSYWMPLPELPKEEEQNA